jgi:hypothetical protein
MVSLASAAVEEEEAVNKFAVAVLELVAAAAVLTTPPDCGPVAPSCSRSRRVCAAIEQRLQRQFLPRQARSAGQIST